MPWNKLSDVAIHSQADTVKKHEQFHGGLKAGLAASVILTATYFRELALSEEWSNQIGLLGNALGVLLIINCLSKLYESRKPKKQAQWEQEMSGPQKRLFGFPATNVGVETTRAASDAPKQSPLPPLGVPERHAKPITPMSSSGSRSRLGTQYNLDSAGRLRSRDSPFSPTPAVVTPEQLKPYLVPFEMPSASPGDKPGASSHEEGRQQYAPLFPGTDETIQHYRPSLQLKNHTASPLRPDAALYPSSSEAYEAVLARLETDARTMDVWVDRLREWLAQEVFKPLRNRMASAHKEVSAAALKLGGLRVELSNLGDPEQADSRGIQADEEAQLAGLTGNLQNALRGTSNDAQRQDVANCLQGLSKLLRGEWPSGLLGPVPRGYIAARVRQLAEGPCLKDFTWNSGGPWRSKPWSSELLTDSALVFYVFAAYLQAPGWYFALDGGSPRSVAAPLYIGSLPTRPARCCTALLPVRPTALPPESTAILALALATQKPQFTLVLQCKPALTTTDYRAVFIHIILLIQTCKLHNFGMIGHNDLKFLKLERVIAPANSLLDVFKSRWFSL